MQIDSIRIYQSRDPTAHVGANHTVGCDPPEYPTREWIRGHEYRYMRNPPFSYDDLHPLRNVQNGGGACKTDADCGANINHENLTQIYEASLQGASDGPIDVDASTSGVHGRQQQQQPQGLGRCVAASSMPAMFSMVGNAPSKVCLCNPGFTGPHCHAQAHFDDSPSAEALKMMHSPFRYVVEFQTTPFMLVIVCTLLGAVLVVLVYRVQANKRELHELETPKLRRPKYIATNATAMAGEDQSLLITGTSI